MRSMKKLAWCLALLCATFAITAAQSPDATFFSDLRWRLVGAFCAGPG